MLQNEKFCLIHTKIKAVLINDPELGYLSSKEIYEGEKYHDYIVVFDTEYEALAFIGFKKFDIYTPALLSVVLGGNF